MGALVCLSAYMTRQDWARACITAARLQTAEEERAADKRAADRAWRERPRAPAPEQGKFSW